MAEIKKTSIRRYNGTDWDTIYLATTSDITSLGVAITVADEVTGWARGDVVAANTSVRDILAKVINRIQYIDNTSWSTSRAAQTSPRLRPTRSPAPWRTASSPRMFMVTSSPV